MLIIDDGLDKLTERIPIFEGTGETSIFVTLSSIYPN